MARRYGWLDPDAANYICLALLAGFLGRADVWAPMFWALAALTMTVGNLIALRQTNVVRLFAFPSVPDASVRLAGGERFIYRLTLTTVGFAEHAWPLAV